MKRPDKFLYRSAIRFFLGRYRRLDPLAFHKARLQLVLLFASFSLMPLFMFQGLLGEGVEPTVALPLGIGMFIILGLSFLLRAGHYLLSGHLFLALLFALVWNDMFFAYSAAPINRLDTIVLLHAALLMAPLLTDQRGLLFHFGANLIVLILFLSFNPEMSQLPYRQLDAYAADAVVSLCTTGIVALLLLRTTARARRRVERANAHLEETVRLRTSALRQTTEELRLSMDEMSRDMEMARKLQRNMILLAPPASADWELAVSFRPVAPVSGDFFDFYMEGDSLAGVGLFDVSGHGVSSGLITILARSILFRHFREAQDADPGRILERANEELIGELRKAYYFLSGVLLRFDGDRLRLASAGHPDVLISRRDGSTEPIDEQKPEPDSQRNAGTARGNLMGIAALADRYPMITARIRTGDALLLYSDGLIDATNADREAYGPARLIRSLETTAGLGVEERLDRVIGDLNAFLGDASPGDDSTAILLQKKS